MHTVVTLNSDATEGSTHAGMKGKEQKEFSWNRPEINGDKHNLTRI